MSEFFTSRRAVATALVVGLGLFGCSKGAETNDEDVNHYIQNAPSPHSQNSSIPEGKVLPPDATVQFHDGVAEYQASPEVAASTGLFKMTVFCGNPIDKRDPHNLYAAMDVKREDGTVGQVMAGIAVAAACADGTITAADRPVL